MYLKMCALLYYLCLQTFLARPLLPLVCVVLSHPESIPRFPAASVTTGAPPGWDAGCRLVL